MLLYLRSSNFELAMVRRDVPLYVVFACSSSKCDNISHLLGILTRTQVLDLSDDVSRKLDFEDEDEGAAAMMIPLDSPPPFDDDSTPDDDPFNASNRPSSIGRVSDFPPIDEIGHALESSSS